MHQTLRIPEILLNIFGYYLPPTTTTSSLEVEQCSYCAHLAALARTCKAFREPALDVLWEELHDLSPLARCLPEVCHLSNPLERFDQPCYLLSRPLKEAEWKVLRSYTRRVRSIHGFESTYGRLHDKTIKQLFSVAPFVGSLFPHLRSLYWHETTALDTLRILTPSLTSLCLKFLCPPRLSAVTIDTFGDCCPHIEKFEVDIRSGGFQDAAISRQVSRWPKLRVVQCPTITLSFAAILQLSSISTLKSLVFTAEFDSIQDISHVGSTLVFSSLGVLTISTDSLDAISLLFSHIQLPVIENLVVTTGYISRRAIQAYWTALREACPSNSPTSLYLEGFRGHEVLASPGGEPHPRLELEDLRPCAALTELRELCIDFECSVNLTDSDLFDLVPPRLEKLVINKEDWRILEDGGGITLRGLLRLLRRCPSLYCMCLAIDTRTFTKIPDGCDVSFSPRRPLEFDFVDSCILPEFVPGLVSVFTVLGLNRSMLMVDEGHRRFVNSPKSLRLWKRVLRRLRRQSDLPLEM